MPLIAENHFQFILEVGAIIFAFVTFTINLVPISLSVITFLSLFLSVGFTLLFGADLLMLLMAFGQNEFTHPFGPIALLSIITALASLKVMEDSGVNVKGLQKLVFGLLIGVSVFGGLMHRSFLLLWILGLFIGYLLISKSFRQKSILTVRRILMFLGLGGIAFAALEIISIITNMDVFSPLVRVSRIETNSLASLKVVLQNAQLIGHTPGSAYWGAQDTGFASGYISLPMSFILMFGLPFPLFYGLLVTKKDAIDYMLPGIFGYSFDFGYLGLVCLLGFTLFTIFIGLTVLKEYRERREKNNKKYLGKEVLLIGSLTAFIAQAIIGLFLFNRSINGTALLTFIFLAALVIAHVVSIKRD